VTAAMKAKDSSVTVTSVRKDPDGSYDVLGTKAGANVMYDVSTDLTTVTQNTHADGRQGTHIGVPLPAAGARRRRVPGRAWCRWARSRADERQEDERVGERARAVRA
jgi:hypothetical protein